MAKKIDYASLFTLRADGRYCATYTDERGKRHYLYDKDPAALWHKLHDPRPVKVLTFRALAEAWHTRHWEEIRPGTQSCYAAFYARVVERNGDRAAAELTPSDVRAHLERMKEQGYSVRSIKAVRTIYRLIYRNAILDDELGRVIRYNPAEAVPLPQGAKRPVKRDAPPNETIARIRAEAMRVDFGLFGLMLVSTGFRRGEALALQWRDVDLKRRRIVCTKTLVWRGSASIGEPKTVSGVRTVPILPDLLPALRFSRPADAAPTDYIFHGEDPTKPMYESYYHRHWHDYCVALGFVDADGKHTLTAHFLRHGYATMLYEAGVDAYAAQKLLGHSDIQTTLAIYTHLREERETASLKKLNTYVKKQIN